MAKRISLFGGPGSGKSTTAAWLFSELKTLNYPIELVGEYVKGWTYISRDVKPFDQVYLFGKQLQSEYLFLNAGKNIVTDSPVPLCCYYTEFFFNKLNLHPYLLGICREFERAYPSLNIFLNRKQKTYDATGRYQTYEQALELDEFFKQKQDFVYIDYDDRASILKAAQDFLK